MHLQLIRKLGTHFIHMHNKGKNIYNTIRVSENISCLWFQLLCTKLRKDLTCPLHVVFLSTRVWRKCPGKFCRSLQEHETLLTRLGRNEILLRKKKCSIAKCEEMKFYLWCLRTCTSSVLGVAWLGLLHLIRMIRAWKLWSYAYYV